MSLESKRGCCIRDYASVRVELTVRLKSSMANGLVIYGQPVVSKNDLISGTKMSPVMKMTFSFNTGRLWLQGGEMAESS